MKGIDFMKKREDKQKTKKKKSFLKFIWNVLCAIGKANRIEVMLGNDKRWR